MIALTAENLGHVKAVAEMTKTDLDPVLGRAVAADGVGTVITSTVGGSPTTTYAENIGVMAATRVYSTAAYFVAAIVGDPARPDPEVRRDRQRHPAGRARRHHARALRHDRPARRQDLEGERRRLRPARSTWSRSRRASSWPSATPALKITDDFILTGIALGTIVVVGGYHLARVVARAAGTDDDEGAVIVGPTGADREPAGRGRHR